MIYRLRFCWAFIRCKFRIGRDPLIDPAVTMPSGVTKYDVLYGVTILRPEFAVHLLPETWAEWRQRWLRILARPWLWPIMPWNWRSFINGEYR